MSKIIDRYSSAVSSGNLKSRPETVMSDTDVLGAFGIANRRLSEGEDQFKRHELAVPLQRLFMGDDSAGRELVRIMTASLLAMAKEMHGEITRTQAHDMARAVLAWFRSNACRVCGGHGFKLIPGTKTIGDAKCVPCAGSGKIQIEARFHKKHRDLVRWLVAQVESEAGRAGPAAMKALAPRLDL